MNTEYAAGLFDGEGCVFIRKHKAGGKRGRGTTYQVSVSVGMVTPEPIRRLQETFGGSIHISRRKNPEHRDQYQWTACSKIAERFLRQLLPHLIVKKDEALLVLEFQENIDKYAHKLTAGCRRRGKLWFHPEYEAVQAWRESTRLRLMEMKTRRYS